MEQRLKIAYILTPVTFGGAERVSLNFLKSVDRLKFDVHPILFLRPWDDEPYFKVQLRNLSLSYTVLPVAIKEFGDYFRPIRCFSNVYSVLKNGLFDLVHTHGYLADMMGISSCFLLKLPHMATCHGFVATDRKLDVYNKIDRVMLRLSNRVVCVSESIKDSLIIAGVSGKKVRVIPNAVPIGQDCAIIDAQRKAARRQFGTEDEEIVVGYSGRLSSEKNLKSLILAFSEIHKNREGFQLWVIGDGPQRAELQELVDEKGISEHVFFTGFKENAVDLMAGMDIFVLPSLTEGTPMAMLEAMSIGLPVIASSVGEIPRIINCGENGLLISPGNTRDLVQAIMRIHNDQTLAKQLSENAKRDIKLRFSTEKWARKIEQTYSEIVNERWWKI